MLSVDASEMGFDCSDPGNVDCYRLDAGVAAGKMQWTIDRIMVLIQVDWEWVVVIK